MLLVFTINVTLSSFADTKEGRYNPKMDPVIPVYNWRKGSQVTLLPTKPAHMSVYVIVINLQSK